MILFDKCKWEIFFALALNSSLDKTCPKCGHVMFRRTREITLSNSRTQLPDSLMPYFWSGTSRGAFIWFGLSLDLDKTNQRYACSVNILCARIMHARYSNFDIFLLSFDFLYCSIRVRVSYSLNTSFLLALFTCVQLCRIFLRIVSHNRKITQSLRWPSRMFKSTERSKKSSRAKIK